MRVTEKKRIKIYSGQTCNPVYLCWLNAYGGFSYWLFTGWQQMIINVKEAGILERYIENISTATTREDYLKKTCNESMILGADNLTDNDIEGIKGLLKSVRVQVLVDNTPTWMTVLVKAESFKIKRTDSNKHSVELEIAYPSQTIQTQ
jgi:hypothetical protein